MLGIQLMEDLQYLIGNGSVADQLALMRLTIEADMQHAYVTQIRALDGTSFRIRLPFHSLEHRIGYMTDRKAAVGCSLGLLRLQR